MTVVYLQPAPRPRPVPVPWLIPHYPRGVPEQIAGELDLPQPEPQPQPEPAAELELDVPEQAATAGLPTVLAWALAPLGGAALWLSLLWLGAPIDAAALITVAIAVGAISFPLGQVNL